LLVQELVSLVRNY